MLANQLLDYFGYKKGADGYRNDPSGKPLTIVLTSEPLAIMREYDELWKKALDAIGLRFETRKGPFSDNIKAAEGVPARDVGLVLGRGLSRRRELHAALLRAQYHQSNHACYESAAFDRLYDQMKAMPESPERDRLFDKLSRQLEVDGVLKMGVSRYRNVLVYPQVQGYRYHPMLNAAWEYLDIDPAAARKP